MFELPTHLNDYFDVYIYHDKCMDGLTAVGIALQPQLKDGVLNPNITLIAATHGTKLDLSVLVNKSICFLDFSVSKTDMLAILDLATHVTVMDHHISVYEELCSIDHPDFYYVYRSDKSGAQIAWECFIGGEEPYFIQLIGDRDLWTKTYIDADVLHLALRVEEFSVDKMIPFIEGLLLNFRDSNTQSSEVFDGTAELIRNGYNYKKYHNQIVQQIASHAYKSTLDDGTPTLKVNCPLGFVSDVGAYLYTNRGVEVAHMYYHTKDKTYNSLRVAKDSAFDASAYAKKLNGGGHRSASGWVTYNS